MNKKQYWITFGILLSITLALSILGVMLAEFLIFGVTAFIILFLGILILQRKKGWIEEDERTLMISYKASHYTFITLVILGLIASFILEYAGIDRTSGQILRMFVLLMIIVRVIFWGYINGKYT
ncbi:MAG: hypothetical protein ACMUHY_03330 [Thermoplasmatota archaeon]